MRQGDNYLFIDGAYLRERYDSTVPRWVGGPAELDMERMKHDCAALKCFYYDCADVQRKGQSDEEYLLRRGEQDKLFSKIRRSSGTHVKLGNLVREAKGFRQKQVDILLAVDMLTHAARGNLKEAILIAGDQDFKPVVESLVNMGVFVTVWSDTRSFSSELIDAADAYEPLSFDRYLRWTEESQVRHLEQAGHGRGMTVHPGPHQNRTGLVGGQKAKMVTAPNYCCIEIQDDEGQVYVKFTDKGRCLLYCELQYGKVEGFE